MKAARTSYKIALKVDAYLKSGGTHKALQEALGFKTEEFLLKKIEEQTWTKDNWDAILASGLIAKYPRREKRQNLPRAEEITKQVREWNDELGNMSKLRKAIGIKDGATMRTRMTLHNWTTQELKLLINKHIVDDSLEH